MLLVKEKPQVLRRDLRESDAPEMLLRRAIVGASFIGTVCMAVTTLFQMGFFSHLADPPIETGGVDRAEKQPLVPLAATAAAAPAAITAARYLFHDMPVTERRGA